VPMNSKRVSMPTMTVSVQRIWSCPKRSLDHALGRSSDTVDLGYRHHRERGQLCDVISKLV
jgi:hypothetical protein